MTIFDPAGNEVLEYKFLKYDTHGKAEKGLNEHIAEGWHFVSYQAAGDAAVITHFLVVARAKRPERTRFGFGP